MLDLALLGPPTTSKSTNTAAVAIHHSNNSRIKLLQLHNLRKTSTAMHTIRTVVIVGLTAELSRLFDNHIRMRRRCHIRGEYPKPML